MPVLSEGKSFYITRMFPCSDSGFGEIQQIIQGLRSLYQEFLVVELLNYPERLLFIQTYREGSGRFLIELGLGDDPDACDSMYQISSVDQKNCENIFQEACLFGRCPDLRKWKDVTDEIFHEYQTAAPLPFPAPGEKDVWHHIIKERINLAHSQEV